MVRTLSQLSILHNSPPLLISGQYLCLTPVLTSLSIIFPTKIFHVSLGLALYCYLGFPNFFVCSLLSNLCIWPHKLYCLCCIDSKTGCTPKSYFICSSWACRFLLPFTRLTLLWFVSYVYADYYHCFARG